MSKHKLYFKRRVDDLRDRASSAVSWRRSKSDPFSINSKINPMLPSPMSRQTPIRVTIRECIKSCKIEISLSILDPSASIRTAWIADRGESGKGKKFSPLWQLEFLAKLLETLLRKFQKKLEREEGAEHEG
jgi:hypothetical protein